MTVYNQEDIDNAYGGLAWLQDSLNGTAGPAARALAIKMCLEAQKQLFDLAKQYRRDVENGL